VGRSRVPFRSVKVVGSEVKVKGKCKGKGKGKVKVKGSGQECPLYTGMGSV
jgi:hypothetical protein